LFGNSPKERQQSIEWIGRECRPAAKQKTESITPVVIPDLKVDAPDVR